MFFSSHILEVKHEKRFGTYTHTHTHIYTQKNTFYRTLCAYFFQFQFSLKEKKFTLIEPFAELNLFEKGHISPNFFTGA